LRLSAAGRVRRHKACACLGRRQLALARVPWRTCAGWASSCRRRPSARTAPRARPPGSVQPGIPPHAIDESRGHRLTGDECCVCRERGDTPRQQKAAFLGCDSPDGDDEAAGEMCEELMQIFAGSPRCAPPGPTDCSTGGHVTVQPPSRNQNPLIKDQVRVPARSRRLAPSVLSPPVCIWAEVFNGLDPQ
jgi:hypothetical protein